MPTSFSKHPYAGTSYSGADMLVAITIKDAASHKNTTCVLGELQTLSYSTHMERGSVRKLGNVNVSDYTNGPRTIAGSLVFAVFNRHMIQPVLDQMDVKEKVLPDELPPFDVTITFANEYGHSSVLRIYGVRLVNEGEVLSTNDIYIENTYQYVAQNIEILQSTELPLYDKNADNQNANNNNPDNNILNAPDKNDIIDTEYHLPQPEEENKSNSTLLVSIDDKNYAWFNVDIIQKDLVLVINKASVTEKRYEILEKAWPYPIKMEPGHYTATLEKTDGTVYNTVSFEINRVRPLAPYVTGITHQAISGKVIDTNILSALCLDPNFVEKRVNIINQSFVITGLEQDTEYLLIACDSFGQQSGALPVKTLADYGNPYMNFENFMKTNKLNDPEAIAFIQEAESLDLPFIESFFKVYRSRKQSKRLGFNPDHLMHLAAYYDLCISQKNFHFDFKNKWLGDIGAPKNHSTMFKAYDQNGIGKDSRNMSNIVRYQHIYNQICEKMTTYKPNKTYQHALQNVYLSQHKLINSMRESFNARYGMLPIDTYYDFYDYSLNSNGAYIDIVDACYLKAHYRSPEAYFVFKEDLGVDVVFKIKADNQIDFKTLDFYDARNNYIVYLEYDNQPISKSVRIINNKAEYAYGTLLSEALNLKMQDFVRELCIEQLNALDMFCYGFYLLVNRKQLSSNYIKLFDILFYSYTKGARVKFYKDDRYLYFSKPVDYLLFDRQGNYLETGYGEKVLIKLSGYLVWSTVENNADCLNFENI